jgi:hypothetical protein
MDFATYCMRKHTLRAYTDMLSWEERLRRLPAYFRGAAGLVKVCVCVKMVIRFVSSSTFMKN